MSARSVIVAVGISALIVMTNTGCYYDQLLQEQKANRTLQEELARAKDDLHAAESMNQVLKTKIESLNGQLATKEQLVASLTAENESLRDKWGKAMAALEEIAKRGGERPILNVSVLPPKLSEALKALADRHPGLLEFDERTGAVRWKSDLLFPLGEDSLGDAAAGPLKEFADILLSDAAAGFDAVIVGHTCNTPIRKPETLRNHKTNWHLSTHRAISVMNALSSDGVPETRMGCMGYGEFRPIAPNTTAENKAKNRRVEIYLIPSEKAMTTSTVGVYEAKDSNLTYAKPADAAKPAAKKPAPGNGPDVVDLVEPADTVREAPPTEPMPEN